MNSFYDVVFYTESASLYKWKIDLSGYMFMSPFSRIGRHSSNVFYTYILVPNDV